MPAIVPFDILISSHQTDESFMNEGGRLKRLSRLFSREFRCGQSAQFVVDQDE